MMAAGAEKRRFHNIFFALYPDEETAERAVELTDDLRLRYGLAGRPMARDRLHITLNAVVGAFELPRELIDRAMAAADKVRMAPFVVGLDRVVSWKSRRARPLVVVGDEGDIGARMLHEQLQVALRQAKVVKPGKRNITPHMTLLRDRVETPETLIRPMRFAVREFRLIDSPYGESRHNILGRWPLEP